MIIVLFLFWIFILQPKYIIYILIDYILFNIPLLAYSAGVPWTPIDELDIFVVHIFHNIVGWSLGFWILSITISFFSSFRCSLITLIFFSTWFYYLLSFIKDSLGYIVNFSRADKCPIDWGSSTRPKTAMCSCRGLSKSMVTGWTQDLASCSVIKTPLVAQMVKNLPAILETWVRSLGQEDPLEKETATHSSILAWEFLWREGVMGSQSRTGLSTNTFAFCCQRCDSPETTSLTLASVSSSVSSGAQSLKRWAHSAFGPATADKCTVPSWTADVTGTDTGIERGSYQLPTSAVGKQARNGPGLPSSKLEQL